MAAQFVCPGCTYTSHRRGPACPMCGALMERIEPEAKKPIRHGGPFAPVPFVP